MVVAGAQRIAAAITGITCTVFTSMIRSNDGMTGRLMRRCVARSCHASHAACVLASATPACRCRQARSMSAVMHSLHAIELNPVKQSIGGQ
jgi:hypothetical protein